MQLITQFTTSSEQLKFLVLKKKMKIILQRGKACTQSQDSALRNVRNVSYRCVFRDFLSLLLFV